MVTKMDYSFNSYHWGFPVPHWFCIAWFGLCVVLQIWLHFAIRLDAKRKGEYRGNNIPTIPQESPESEEPMSVVVRVETPEDDLVQSQESKEQELLELRELCRLQAEKLRLIQTWPEGMSEEEQLMAGGWRYRCLIAEKRAEEYRVQLVRQNEVLAELRLNRDGCVDGGVDK